MLKSISSIALIVLLVSPFWVLHSLMRLEKYQVRREVKQNLIKRIDRNELIHLKFATSEISEKLKWEHSKEFEYAGEMYDVVERVEAGDTVHFWCWWDNEETKLNKQLTELTQFEFGKTDHTGQKLKHHFEGFKMLQNAPDQESDVLYLALNYSIFRELVFSQWFTMPESPPPV